MWTTTKSDKSCEEPIHLKLQNIAEVKENLNKQRDKFYSGFRCLNVNSPHFVLLIQHIPTKIPAKIPAGFFAELDRLILKFMWKWK